jgi:hypothetical protein
MANINGLFLFQLQLKLLVKEKSMQTNEAYSTRPRHCWAVVAVFNSLVILVAISTLVESRPTANMENPGKLQNNDSTFDYLVNRKVHHWISAS